MTRGWRLYLAARATVPWCLLWTTTLLFVLASGPVVYEVAFVASRLPRYTPVWELAPVVAGVLGIGLLTPRLWTWERIGRRRRLRWRAATCAVLVLVLPASIPWLAHYGLPAGARWWDIVGNVVLLTAVAMLATVMVGRVLGPVIGLGFYAAVLVVQQTLPDVARWLPVSGAQTNIRPHVEAATAAAVIAVVVWTTTLGRSRFADDLARNDSG